MLQSCYFLLYRSINNFFYDVVSYVNHNIYLSVLITTTPVAVPELYWGGVPPGIPKYHRRQWVESLCGCRGATSQWGWSSLLTPIWPLMYANWPVCHSSTCLIYYINNISTHLNLQSNPRWSTKATHGNYWCMLH